MFLFWFIKGTPAVVPLCQTEGRNRTFSTAALGISHVFIVVQYAMIILTVALPSTITNTAKVENYIVPFKRYTSHSIKSLYSLIARQ